MKSFSQFLMEEVELSPLQKKYQDFFRSMLKKYGVSSPADLEEEDMKKFFNEISSTWTKEKEAK